jgi:hypothetical protein
MKSVAGRLIRDRRNEGGIVTERSLLRRLDEKVRV